MPRVLWMIKLIESAEQMPSFPLDPIFLKIEGIALTYGFGYSFALLWRQINDKDEVTAVISSFDGHLSLYALPDADFDELREFIRVVGGISLFCSLHNSEMLEFSGEKCVALKFCGEVGEAEDFDTDHDLRAVYSLLKSGEDGGIAMPSFDAWYVDISHRIRKGTARVFGSDTAVALTSAESENAALIGGVAVLPKARGRGLGKRMVTALTKKLFEEKKTPFVFSRGEEAEFYKKCGFDVMYSAVQIFL